MALSNHDRVGKAITLLAAGLGPYVARECEAEFGNNWVEETSELFDGTPRDANADDPHFLLKVMLGQWEEIFSKKLSQSDRSYVRELQDARNAWAHNENFSTDDALRALDTAQRLLQAVVAGSEANEIDKLRQDLLRQRFDEQARSARKAATIRIEGDSESGLPAWREVIEPHDDVASGQFELAQFAADLHQVWRGEALAEYGDPVEFFRRTFITEGLGNLILGAVRRFSGTGGDPVIKLQTNFGGGKTHSLIALYHLAGEVSATELSDVEQLLAEQNLSLPAEQVNRAVLVGHMLDPASPSEKSDGTVVRTMWGDLAWQLGGAEGYEYVAAADQAGTNPGHALTDLLRAYSPCLVLIDEWVAYARQLYGIPGLPAGSFDAHFSFAQALTDAAKNTPKALLVATIPSSDIEVGGEGGQAALTRLEHLFSRMETNWRTASTEESFEIVRRRLFKSLTPDAAKQRDAVVQVFGDMYREQSSEFPSQCKEPDYRRRMQAAYPIHPELFDRLFGDWSELERFQRTRGVLRLMAKVIHTLWIRDDSKLLILPATIPIDSDDVAAELIRYLDDPWRPVIETDVDGPNSLPHKLDKENPNLARYSATRRVARTIYFGSAPSQEDANKGLDDRSIKLGCVQPGERTVTFGDALRRLSDQARYLHQNGVRYWYSTRETPTRLAQDRAAHVEAEEIDEQIRKRLDPLRSDRAGFAAVHVCPRMPADIPDEDLVRLVVLDPTAPHDAKVEQSEALKFTELVLSERAGGIRRCRNMLLFLAPDKTRLAELRQGVREWLAWDSIERDKDTLPFDNAQVRFVEDKVGEADKTVIDRMAETYQWMLTPTQPVDDPTGRARWENVRVSTADTLVQRVYKKLEDDEAIIPAYSGSRLRQSDLDRVPLWRGDHVEVQQLWEDICQYLYLPRLSGLSVLEGAIRDGVALISWETDGFGYADSFEDGRYIGLRAGEQIAAIAPSGLIVKAEAAARQRAAESPAVGGEGGAPGDSTEVPDDESEPDEEPGVVLPSRYVGRISLDYSPRWTRTVADIADAVVNQLVRVDGTELKITITVEAESESGFDVEVERTVTENAATLKFDSTDFEP